MAVTLSDIHTAKSQVPVKWKVVVEDVGDGTVSIGVNNDSGNIPDLTLFQLKTDGTFYRYPGLGDASGFKTDKSGRIMESKVNE